MTTLNTTQRKSLIKRLNKELAPTKHGRMSNEALIEIRDELDGEEEGESKMGKVLKRYRPTYSVSITPNGRKSRCNGDDIAMALEGCTYATVAAAAEQLLGLKAGEVFSRYSHMNPGQGRMNAGNRIRAAFKRGDITIEQIQKAVAKS